MALAEVSFSAYQVPLKNNFNKGSFILISNGNEAYVVMVSVPVCLSVHLSNNL